MKQTLTLIISSVLGLSLLAAVPAFADQGQQGPNQGPGGGMKMRIWGNGGDLRGQGEIRVQGQLGGQEDGDRESGKPLLGGMMVRPLQGLVGMMKGRGEMIGRSLGGKVTAVNAPNFTLELPRMGDTATTSVTVTTNASTTFLLGKNSASMSDVAVGEFALVAGPFASSTNTITAVRVNLSTSTPTLGQAVRIEVRDAITERFEDRAGTSTPKGFVRGIMNSIFQNFAHFFGR